MSGMEEQKGAGGLRAGTKIGIVAALIVLVGVAIYARHNKPAATSKTPQGMTATAIAAAPAALTESPKAALPRLVDLGSDRCIPCKMMVPILEELKKDHAGKLDVDVIDVWKDEEAGKKYNVELIPTQIFFDAAGKELFRHQGFFAKEDILAKWKELGVSLGPDTPAFSRLEPAQPDTRAKDAICYMCDGDVNPRTRVTLKTEKGDVHLCSPHCYFITWTSLTDKAGVHERAQVTDWATGKPVAAMAATYLIGQDDHHRPTVKAFAEKAAAENEMRSAGGNLADWKALEEKEVANRCGFCDRAVYPEDASRVKVETVSTWGCCPMCALGVAARMQSDIEVEQKDALTGEMIHVVTLSGSVASLEPKTAVAWAGQKKGLDGRMVSAGCFKQAFFVSADNLKKWVVQHATATGRQITINQALSEKMKLTPEQISKACKIGECAPK